LAAALFSSIEEAKKMSCDWKHWGSRREVGMEVTKT
jgi:hypothetical protein